MAQLPAAAYESIAAEVRDPLLRSRVEQARHGAELMPGEVGRSLARGLAIQAQDATSRVGADSDRMLEHLLHELLSHVHEPRRSSAAHLIAASPYAAPVTDGLLDLAADDNELVASRAWDALLAIGRADTADRADTRAVAEERGHLRSAALAALRGWRQPLSAEHAETIAMTARTAPTADVRSHALTALALRSSASLDALIDAGPEIIRAVYWWQGVGNALTDDDTVRSEAAP